MQPRFHPTLLGDGMAVEAHNCRLKNGKLVPLRNPSIVTMSEVRYENGISSLDRVHSMHIWRKADGTFSFLLFPGMTWSAPGNVADDRLARLIVSGETGESFRGEDGNTKMNTPVMYVLTEDTQETLQVLIARNPLSAPYVKRMEETPLDDSRKYTRFFVTWVDEFGIESPPSAASLLENGESEELEYLDGDKVDLWITAGDIPTNATNIRVYKVATGVENGSIFFVREIEASYFAGGAHVSIAVKDTDLGETMPEIEAPPADLMCIHNVPGAFYVGFSPSMPKTVCFSDIGLLYSWPMAYRYDVADNIVALAVTSNNVFALTDGTPYVLSGTAPESMTATKIASSAACVSQRGVCVYGNMVYFASNAGLMMISNNSDEGTLCSNLTEKIFTKDQWQALNPLSCVMGQCNGVLHLFFLLNDGTRKSFSIDLKESADAVTTHDEYARCICVDDKTDSMYYIRDPHVASVEPSGDDEQEGE